MRGANLPNLTAEVLIDPLGIYGDQWSAGHASIQVPRRVWTCRTCTYITDHPVCLLREDRQRCMYDLDCGSYLSPVIQPDHSLNILMIVFRRILTGSA